MSLEGCPAGVGDTTFQIPDLSSRWKCSCLLDGGSQYLPAQRAAGVFAMDEFHLAQRPRAGDAHVAGVPCVPRPLQCSQCHGRLGQQQRLKRGMCAYCQTLTSTDDDFIEYIKNVLGLHLVL